MADNSIKVRGRITDKSGNALIGARVSTADNKSMTITDVDGNFALEIPADGMTKIEVSYLGMQPLQFTVNGKQDKPIELVMADDVHQLNEVFVTGYQTITRERSTGAYDMLKGNVLDKPAVNIAQRLVGTVAGIHSTQDANGNVSMTVRGQGTFLPSSPLVVIDGFATTEGLSSINPNDVENITVLKDAAASSIWGARASNGVIVVTTKKAKKSQPLQITFSSFLKIGAKTDLAYLRNLASSAQQVDYEESIFGKYGYSALSPEVSPGNFKNGYFRHFTQGQMLYNQYANGYITEDEMKTGLSRLRSLDNSRQIEDAFLRRPTTQQYNLSVQGGSDRMRNYLSANYNYDSSRFKRTHDSSLQADYRASIAATKWLDVDVAAMLRYVNSNMSGANVSMIRELGPYDMLRNSDGSLADMSYSQWYTPMIDAMVPKEDFPYTDWTYNPIREIQNRELTRKTMTNRVQAGLTFKLTDGLTFNTKLQYERADAKDRSLYGENTWMVRRTVNTTSTWNMATGNVTPNMPLGGFLDESNILTTSYDFRNQLDFSHMFGQWLQLSAIAGFELMQNRVE
ncbi:MAG: carboxypeptidase-like regulatory domain-containing protein, partial [Prevotella sp.]|nr:carboxypeptidase-like regulatory domain-containing protein [Prevotella sp.]